MYLTCEDAIVFYPEFNNKLYFQLLYNYKKIIFSEYSFNEDDYKYMYEIYKIDNLFYNKSGVKTPNNFNKYIDMSGYRPRFGSCFNQPINMLPNSITHLTFCDMFNQPVGMLPSSLTHLTFGNDFNQLVDMLPNFVTHLTWRLLF